MKKPAQLPTRAPYVKSLALVDVAVSEVGAVATHPVVDLLAPRDLVGGELGALGRRESVEAGIVLAEDGALDRAVGGAEPI